MSLMDWFKYLILGNKDAITPPRIAETPIEDIVFPDTYKRINLLSIGERPNGLLSGSQFGQTILNIPATQQRDDLIYQQCIMGNIPNWMRQFKAITIEDKGNVLTYFVSPDVLCIGNDTDFLRVSLNGYTAQRIVDFFNCMLPTKKLSDQIWKAANLKMMPVGMGGSFNISSTQTLIDHNNIIEKQRAGRNFNIITGHKKDIVYTKHLLIDKTRLAIYGWHYPDGRALQGPTPNSTSHNVEYQDYSSSIRLVSQTALLNQQVMNLYDILNSKEYAYLISDEGYYNASSIYK